MASSDLTSLSGYSSTSFSPSTTTTNNPPPPPPKPTQSSSIPTSSSQTPTTYPPPTTTNRPPPPPPPPQHPQTPSSSTPQQTYPPTQPPNPPPPDPSEHWLPEAILDKPTSALHTALSTPPLLTALSLTHPSLTPSPLPPHLIQTQNLATHLQTQHTHLLSLRQRVQTHLLHLHALERQWREKQARMDRELEAWSAKGLYQRLKEGEREGEEWTAGLERSWLEGEGEYAEREVEGFLRGYREGRGKVWRRREARERWDEGRVGGWR